MKIEKFVDVLCGWSCIEVEKEYDINGNVHKLFGLWKSKPGRNKGELRVAKRWQQMDAQCRREARREGKGRRRKKPRMDFATANLKLREGTKKRDSLIALICGSNDRPRACRTRRTADCKSRHFLHLVNAAIANRSGGEPQLNQSQVA